MISLRLLVHNDEALPKLYPTEDFQLLLSEKWTSDFLSLKFHLQVSIAFSPILFFIP